MKKKAKKLKGSKTPDVFHDWRVQSDRNLALLTKAVRESRIHVSPPVVVESKRNPERDQTLLALANACQENARAIHQIVTKLAEAPSITIKDGIVFASPEQPAYDFRSEDERRAQKAPGVQ